MSGASVQRVLALQEHFEERIEHHMAEAVKAAVGRFGDRAAFDVLAYLLEQAQEEWDTTSPIAVAARGHQKHKHEITPRLRQQVYERDAYRCVRCGDWHNLQVDHIYPESLGGPTTLENLQTMCGPCNLRKGNTP